MTNFHLYSDGQPRALPELRLNPKLNDPSLYKPSKGLQDAMNVALALGQPLLVTGEPGTGKTQLAHHLSWFFGLGKTLVFNAQTTSAATDLFYKYDALGHFQYAQTQKTPLTTEDIEREFIHYQALGEAIRSDERRVVLIDEIDKAPRDLPNDVLAAIEHLEFRVGEIRKTYAAKPENRPLVVITSNSEKNLPDAFLRRVTYYHIPFPSAEELAAILASKVEGYKGEDFQRMVAHFQKIRDSKLLRKDPATAELIFWATLLQKLNFDTKKLDSPSDPDRNLLLTTYSILAKTKEDLLALNDLMTGRRAVR